MLVNAKKRLPKLIPGILMHVYCYFIVLLAVTTISLLLFMKFSKNKDIAF